ncbi:DNA-methyltransferase [Picrophilus oshimae]|uniref:Type II methyltransferase n=1 Tax=Picrophilus torridus (strain ATCC 700027 / DSM 9790 / JCM 10055 / NBRC 100828 / KAW 2/3) TaxID=1122961 RepID=Q6L1I2_PICTO|nr:site-specific DNA-methyltransferase [Picrophilus oshimae]AAT43170.1 type II restriction modification system, methylation subunit [Picrophilus oshimae DSM 9789]
MKGESRKTGSSTSPFGSPSRANHDSSRFYNSRLYEGLLKETNTFNFSENKIPESTLDKIFLKSSEKMDEIPDDSVHLMITSPPYNVGKLYDKDMSLAEYREFLVNVWKEVYRVLVPGGRACINIANLGRKPYIPLHAYIIEDMIKLGYLMRGEIIWNKGNTASSSVAWGTYMSAKNPVLRDSHEYILVFSKKSFTRGVKEGMKSTMTKEEFIEYTKSIWSINAESATKIGHPAPFPVELPKRLIKLYSFEDEVVLDPFIGSGTTAIAAIELNRHYIGYDIDQEYINIANSRIRALLNIKAQRVLDEQPTDIRHL